MAAQNADPWRLRLERLRGQVGDDGIERITTQVSTSLRSLNAVEEPALADVLAKLMAELGWMAVRVRGLTRGGYLEQVRGYCRDARDRQSIHLA